MKLTEIKKIEEVLLVDKPLLRHKISNLAAPARNNGTFLLNVELRLKNEKNFEEKFEVVAKLLVPNGNLSKTEAFKREIAFYKLIIPLVQEFLQSQEVETIDLFPKYFGGRLTLNDRTKEVDKDAVFFLENLKNSGFLTPEPAVGFDLETTKLILKDLAKFHASFLAIKIRKPEIFKHKIKSHINNSEDSIDKTLANDIKQVVSLMWENEGCVSLIPRVRRAMAGKKLAPPEPLSTIIHNDFWSNNIMVKLKRDKPEKIKFVDFQQYNYGSPAVDVVFFLFTSVELSALRENLDELISHYYEHFASALQSLNCEVPSLSFVEFSKAVDLEAKSSQFPSIMAKLNSIFTPKHIEEHQKRAWYVVKEFAKRNWI